MPHQRTYCPDCKRFRDADLRTGKTPRHKAATPDGDIGNEWCTGAGKDLAVHVIPDAKAPLCLLCEGELPLNVKCAVVTQCTMGPMDFGRGGITYTSMGGGEPVVGGMHLKCATEAQERIRAKQQALVTA